MLIKALLALVATTSCELPISALSPVAGEPPHLISELPHPDVVVVLDVAVSPDGAVASARVASSNSEKRIFAYAALNSVRRWRFAAAGEHYSGAVVVRFPARR
ncbi:MAG: TonB family protein [Lysobacteraceae bacterium]